MMLRVAAGADGTGLWLTGEESERAAKESALAAKESAERRVRELEAIVSAARSRDP